MNCAYCNLQGIIERGHCANCRAKYKQHPMIAQGYATVHVEPSNSSYGRWVVKYSPASFRFFWKKEQAEQWASEYNLSY